MVKSRSFCDKKCEKSGNRRKGVDTGTVRYRNCVYLKVLGREDGNGMVA